MDTGGQYRVQNSRGACVSYLEDHVAQGSGLDEKEGRSTIPLVLAPRLAPGGDVMFRNIVGIVGVVIALLIVGDRVMEGVKDEFSLNTVFWATLVLATGFSVMLEIDRRILRGISVFFSWFIEGAINWVCDLIGAPEDWPPEGWKKGSS